MSPRHPAQASPHSPYEPTRAAGTGQAAARTGDRSWPVATWRAAPSWLVSAILHFSALILFSLIYSSGELAHVSRLSASWAVAKDETASELLPEPSVLSLDRTSKAAEESAAKAASEPKELAAEPETARDGNTAKETSRPPVAKPSSAGDKPTTVGVSLPGEAPAPAAMIQPSARRDGSAKVSAPRSAESALYEGLSEGDAHDALIDRFTQADIGQLRGRQGQEAKEDFAKLGTDAIPALVRGLNRSAKIAHSCPVTEIYRKLDQLLARTDDPYLLLYALENTGHGVHPRAEHWQQIVTARNQWLKKYGERVAPLRRQLDTELRPRRALEGGRPLSEADADELALAVTHTEAKVREEALSVIAKRGMTFGDAERYEIAQPLIAQLEDADPALRQAARRTLIALSGGRSIGPSEEALDRDPAAAAVWWRDRWTQFVLSQTLARGRSSLLVEALGSSTRRERVEALREFHERRPVLSVKQRIQAGRALAKMLGDTETSVQDGARAAMRVLANGTEVDTSSVAEAQAWSDYWDQIENRQVHEPQAGSLLAMARSLEERGSRDAAMRYYRRIVREFPRTSAAVKAKERLGEQASAEPATAKPAGVKPASIVP